MTNANKHNSRQRPYAFQKGEGDIYHFGIDFVVKSSEIQQSSGVAVLEYLTSKGEEPEDHTHPSEDEMFYVLAGAISFRCGDQTFALEEGGFMFLPRGIKHGYTIQSDSVRLLVITSPVRESAAGGWGGFVSDMEKSE